jgi:hypothetical protein
MKNYKSIFILFFSLFAISTLAQDKSAQQILEDRGEVYFSFQIEDRDLIHEFSSIISIDKIEENTVFAYANKTGFDAFCERGFSYKVLTEPSLLIYPNMLEDITTKQIKDWDFYPTYEAYVAMMYQFEADYPEICDVFSIGQSNEGRELLVAKISDNVTEDEGEPEFLYTSSIHGNEITAYPLMLRLIDSLLSTYESAERIANMIDHLEIFINPLANPDGTYRTGNQSVNGATRFNAYNVDLNRNYPDPEDGPNPDGNSWQTETLRFMEFAEDRHFTASCNFHGGEEVCNYPWDTWQHLSADDEWWQYVCHEYADTAHNFAPPEYLSGFDNGITNGYAWYTISGGRQDYMNFFHQCREFTMEISYVKIMPASLLPDYWEYNKRSFLNYMEQSLYGIGGSITDVDTGDPIKAMIYINNHDEDSSWVYSSALDGSYHRLIHEGTYSVTFSAPGYYSQINAFVEVQNRNLTTLNVELLSDGSGIYNYQLEEYFSIGPNPVQNRVFINYLKDDMVLTDISIYNIKGELVQNQQCTFSTHQFQTSISFKGKSPGVYFMHIKSPLGVSTYKVIRK